jgi:transcriptional regulator with XRE-family HTH domain
MDHETLAKQLIRALRDRRSQVAFSRRLGFRTNVLYAWESGRRWPTAATFLVAARKVGIDVEEGLTRFFPARPAWMDQVELPTPEGVAALLGELRQHEPIVEIARRAGRSRYAVARWLSREAEPRLPDFLRMVEACSLRLLDFVAIFTDPAALDATRAAWRTLDAQRRAVYEEPWLPAILLALELPGYAGLPRHEPGWIARRLGIPIEDEARCLRRLTDTGQIHMRRGRFRVSAVQTVDTRPDPDAENQLKRFWAGVGLERLTKRAPGLFSFNVFTVSEADLARLSELHRSYFQTLRAIIAESRPLERVVVANVQLFALDDG